MFECSKISDAPISKENEFPSMKEMTLAELRYLKAKAVVVDRFLAEDERDGAVAAKMWPPVIRTACQSIPARESDLKGMLLFLVARCLRNRRMRECLACTCTSFWKDFLDR